MELCLSQQFFSNISREIYSTVFASISVVLRKKVIYTNMPFLLRHPSKETWNARCLMFINALACLRFAWSSLLATLWMTFCVEFYFNTSSYTAKKFLCLAVNHCKVDLQNSYWKCCKIISVFKSSCELKAINIKPFSKQNPRFGNFNRWH